jgi:hypothetical protein
MGMVPMRNKRKKTIRNITSGIQVILFKFDLVGIWGLRRLWNELEKSPDFQESILLLYSFG